VAGALSLRQYLVSGGDAVRWAEEQESRVRSLDWTDPSRAKVTIGELAEAWLATHEVKPKTRASYESLLKTCVLPRWGDVRLERVTTAVKSLVAPMRGARNHVLSASRRRQAYQML
jgi:hypothetical protein